MGSLYEAFEEDFWYWEPIIILYKMMLVGGLSVVEQHSPIQMFAGFLVCFAYLLLVLRASPYNDETLDKLSFLASLSMCLTLLFGLLKSMDEHARDSEEGWGVPDGLFATVLILLNVIPFVYAGTSTMWRWFQHRKELAASLTHLTHVMPLFGDDKEDKESSSAEDEDGSVLRSWGKQQPVSVPVVAAVVAAPAEKQKKTGGSAGLVRKKTSRQELRLIKKEYGSHSPEYKEALSQVGMQRKATMNAQ